jgi:hypothetical protein
MGKWKNIPTTRHGIRTRASLRQRCLNQSLNSTCAICEKSESEIKETHYSYFDLIRHLFDFHRGIYMTFYENGLDNWSVNRNMNITSDGEIENDESLNIHYHNIYASWRRRCRNRNWIQTCIICEKADQNIMGTYYNFIDFIHHLSDYHRGIHVQFYLNALDNVRDSEVKDAVEIAPLQQFQCQCPRTHNIVHIVFIWIILSLMILYVEHLKYI